MTLLLCALICRSSSFFFFLSGETNLFTFNYFICSLMILKSKISFPFFAFSSTDERPICQNWIRKRRCRQFYFPSSSIGNQQHQQKIFNPRLVSKRFPFKHDEILFRVHLFVIEWWFGRKKLGKYLAWFPSCLPVRTSYIRRVTGEHVWFDMKNVVVFCRVEKSLKLSSASYSSVCNLFLWLSRKKIVAKDSTLDDES